MWSSTPALRDLNQVTHEKVWTMHFQDGTALGRFKKNTSKYVLLVKDGS